MAFESGGISFRLFQLAGSLPPDLVERFAAHAARPLDTVQEQPSRGWVTGRHLLDRHITRETAFFGGYLRLALRIAERKIPPSLLRAECRMEELALQAAEGRPFVNRKERAAIRQAVRDRLMPRMPPQIKGIPMVARADHPLVFVGATAVAQADLFAAEFRDTTGSTLLPLDPEAMMREWFGADPSFWTPASFSDKVPDDEADASPGRDFLTFLWYQAETGSEDGIEVPGEPPVAVLIEGPLTLAYEGEGAHETTLRKGEPVGSIEARTCLRSGKKPVRAKVTLAARGGEPYSFKLDADQGVFRNLSLPRIEELLDPVSLFQERMRRLETFASLFRSVLGVFVSLREDASRWAAVREDMRRWAASRTGRI